VSPLPKLTAEQRAELQAQLDADDDDDESDEVTVSRADGTSFTGSFKRALQLGYVTLPEPPKGKAGAGKDEPRNVSVFGARQARAR
jgi:hypothetical protein